METYDRAICDYSNAYMNYWKVLLSAKISLASLIIYEYINIYTIILTLVLKYLTF